MSKLTDFLIDNPVDDLTYEFTLSARLKNFKVKIKAMSGDAFNEYQKQATSIQKKGKVVFDSGKFNRLVIINHTLEPNFKSAEDVKAVGCLTPEQYLNKVLLAGEIADLAKEISALSGFDTPDDEIVEEAKNS